MHTLQHIVDSDTGMTYEYPRMGSRTIDPRHRGDPYIMESDFTDPHISRIDPFPDSHTSRIDPYPDSHTSRVDHFQSDSELAMRLQEEEIRLNSVRHQRNSRSPSPPYRPTVLRSPSPPYRPIVLPSSSPPHRPTVLRSPSPLHRPTPSQRDTPPNRPMASHSPTPPPRPTPSYRTPISYRPPASDRPKVSRSPSPPYWPISHPRTTLPSKPSPSDRSIHPLTSAMPLHKRSLCSSPTPPQSSPPHSTTFRHTPPFGRNPTPHIPLPHSSTLSHSDAELAKKLQDEEVQRDIEFGRGLELAQQLHREEKESIMKSDCTMASKLASSTSTVKDDNDLPCQFCAQLVPFHSLTLHQVCHIYIYFVRA